MSYSRLFLGARNKLLLPLPVLAGVSWADDRHYSSSLSGARRSFTHMEEKKGKDDRKKEATGKNTGEVFDITKKWKEAQVDARDFWKSSIFTATQKEEKDSKAKEEDKIAKEEPTKEKKDKGGNPLDDFNLSKVKGLLGIGDDDKDNEPNKKDVTARNTSESSANGFQEMASSFVSILSVGGSEESIRRIVKQARESAEEGDVADKKSMEEVMAVLKQTVPEDLKKTADKFLGDVDFSKLYPSSLFYYVEHSDSIKNPSWKRRMHRFYPGVGVDRLEQLNDYLQLAELSYADTVEKIQEGLENNKTPYELVYVNTDSIPNRPAHFVAVKRSQTIWSPYLEVTMCVRGTKTIEDAITDLLCDDEDYRGGKVHAGLLEAGRYLAKKHKKMFKQLLKSSGKPKLSLTLVGHSLGAGAASIIAMEYYEEDDFAVEAIGFGCPALLSKELSENTKHYITTVVADDDCVPRLSAASVVNALLDIMEYDYVPYARRDVKHAFSELQRLYPMIFTKGLSQNIMDLIDPLMDQYLGVKKASKKRMDPLLFPPGNVIHFYRDGAGVTGSVVPCDFFGELHVSRRMVDDHLFFTGYQQIFLELMRTHHHDHNFQFDAAKK